MAFLVCGDFCGESDLRKLGLGGTHPLTRRYIFHQIYLSFRAELVMIDLNSVVRSARVMC